MSGANKYPEMLYQVMDVTAMSYPDESFDMVLDKSTIDALLCSDSPMLLVAKMIWEVYRVLKKGGTYFVVSYGAPKSRMEHLEREHVGFDIEVREIERADSPSGPHYIYICRKSEKSKCDEVKYK
jgi:ubiquinone/menaquinone biosynthesis C-methylase UbiE